ncbi:magnesium transporter MgtE N-terminal domain-containing protein [Chloroflexus sp.]|uniref:magnesium transporter MgtE N-terminal domain-containing protein n=1 Tax=Chloroflexus sp. TaxID=1904827 RepID=UPI002ACDBE6B|nr:hypothetical protein [Chloroflexus sp.]
MDVEQLLITFRSLPIPVRVLVFRLLEKQRALVLCERLHLHEQTELIGAMADPEGMYLFQQLDPVDRALLLEELPARVAKRLLAALSAESRSAISELLGYPKDSVGGNDDLQLSSHL